MTHLAQIPSTPPDMMNIFMPLFQSFGIPGMIVLVIAYTCKKLVIWGTPHVENIIAAWIRRQQTMEDCQVKLTNSTVEIQQKNATVLEAIRRDMPRVCQGFKDFSQATTKEQKHQAT